MLRKYLILMVFMIPFLLKAQIYLGDNGLTVTGTGVNKKVQLGGSLLLNTSFDLGASFTYNIKKGTANYLHILNNGNIGFGTNAPTASFDVVGASRFRNSLTLNYGTANRTIQVRDNGMYFSRTSDGTYTNNITANSEMLFNTAGNYRFINNAVERFTILQSGNVGIGTNNPLAQLHSTGSVRFAGILNDNAAPRVIASDINGNLSWRDATTLGGGAASWAVNGTNVNNTNTGNIGIGITTPASKLDVNGNVRIGNRSFSGYIELEQVNNNQSRIWGGPQESIVFGPGNAIIIKTDVFDVKANLMRIDGNISLAAGNTVTAYMQPGVQGNSTLKVVGNYTNSGAGGSWEGNGYVGAVDVATSIAPTTVTLNQFSVSSKINTTAGTTIHRGFYYNPVLTGTTGLTNIAFEATSGQVKIGGLSGTGSRMVVADANGVLGVQSIPVSGGGSGNWNTIGNNIVNANAGFVSIGTSANPAPTDPQLKLAVNGNIYAQKLKITQQGWADYVFEPTYKLMPLSELEEYIYKNKHLPDVPSAVEVETKGLDLGDNQTILLKKIEELTLYVIELKKEIETIKFKDKAKGNKK